MTVTAVGTAGTAGANAASITPTWPTGVAANDVAYVFWTFQTTVTPTVPTGFTQIATTDNTAGSTRTYIYRKVCAGTETGTLTLTVSGANRQSGCLCVYRGVDPTTPEDVAVAVNAVHTGETTTHPNPAVTTAAANSVIACSVHERATSIDASWTAPSGYTKRADTLALATGTGGTITAVADLFTPQSAGATVTPGVWTGSSATGTPNIITYTIALRDAAPAPAGRPARPAIQSQAVSRSSNW